MKALTIGSLIAAALIVSACSAGAPGRQDPAGATPETAFPPRPHTVDVQSQDPCRSLTQAQVDQYKFVSAERLDFGPSLPGCSYTEIGNDSYLVQFLKFTPAARLLPGAVGQEGTRDTEKPTPAEIDGFGAVQSRLVRGSPADCVVTVDTGPTSSIQFIYKTLDTRADSPADLQTGCDKARRFAHLGLQNLTPS